MFHVKRFERKVNHLLAHALNVIISNCDAKSKRNSRTRIVVLQFKWFERGTFLCNKYTFDK